MRARKTKNGLTLQAVAGANVVLLGMDMAKADCAGHLGFAVHRTDHDENEANWMEGMKTFEATDPGFVAGSKYPTNQHPIQGFTWSDFTAKPGHHYTYMVQALRGSPANLKPFKEVEVEVVTETPDGGVHDVHFNRGAAASQEFARRFGNTAPDEKNPNDPRWAWLSRGAMEAIRDFVARAKDKSWGLRVGAYEFRLAEFAGLLGEASRTRKVDVAVLYDGNPNKPDKTGHVFPRDDNRDAAAAAGIANLCTERVTRKDVKAPPISHDKFIVLLKGGKAQAVLTGSTNYSLGGVFGQGNVVHIANDAAVADAYLQLWNKLQANPDHAVLQGDLSAATKIPKGKPPVGVGTIFSPQQTLAPLEWYAKLAKTTLGALFMTFPFGMGAQFKDAYQNGVAPLRYALLDKLLGPGVSKDKKAAAEAEMLALRKMKENRFAVGSRIVTNKLDRWVHEQLTGLNQHVQYIHTKFMLLDPLGADPIVITGSANFSAASTTANDENMLVIRGDERVADIYVGEYMRLWNHYAFREWASRPENAGVADAKFKFLDTKDRWWREYFGETDRSRQREYFAHAR